MSMKPGEGIGDLLSSWKWPGYQQNWPLNFAVEVQDWFQLVCCHPVLIYLQGGLEPWCCLLAKPKWNILTSDECSPVLGSERPGGSPYQLVWDWSGSLLRATWLEWHKRPLLRWQCGFPETKVPCTYLGGSLPKMKHVLNNGERVLETGAGVWDLSDVCLYFCTLSSTFIKFWSKYTV